MTNEKRQLKRKRPVRAIQAQVKGVSTTDTTLIRKRNRPREKEKPPTNRASNDQNPTNEPIKNV
jgi:hypothetical protein